MFLTFLLNNKNLVIGSILVVLLMACAGYIRIQKSEQTALIAENSKISTMLSESQANIKQLQISIQDQNAAVDKLKVEGDVRVAKHAIEVRQAQVIAATYKQQAAELLTRQAAVNIPKCDAANSLINEEIKNVHK